MSLSGIYKIYSSQVPEKFYVGSAQNLSARHHRHQSDLLRNEHVNQKLQNYFNKYGLDTFCFQIIELCGNDELISREQFYLDKLRPSLNILQTAGSSKGFKHSAKTKLRLRSLAKQRYPSLRIHFGRNRIVGKKL